MGLCDSIPPTGMPGEEGEAEADRMDIAMVTVGKRGPRPYMEEVRDYAKKR